MRSYFGFWLAMIRCAFSGGKAYFIWIGFLAVLVGIGGYFYYEQLEEGLIVTNMTNEVCWGLGTANFVYFVGIGAAAVLLLVPAYIYRNKELKEVVLIGELFAFVAILMCLLFIVTDIGRPDRFWHMIPFSGGGILNIPNSLLAWDVIFSNIYLLLSLHIPGYLLYKMYLGESPRKIFYLPFVLLSMVWAVSLHTVTAFLLSGFGGRFYWNTAILAPRFLVSAFASGPALLILIFTIIRDQTPLKVNDRVFALMRRTMTYTLLVNLFLFGCEIFKELYTDTTQSASAQYLLFGINGRGNLRPFIWSALGMEVAAAVILLLLAKYQEERTFKINLACVLIIVGIWIEKGIGIIIPGFIPSPLGNFMEYVPSSHEVYLCGAILALGLLLFTVMTKVAIGIQVGTLRKKQ